MKPCPFCAEQIQDAAIVCKHCGRDLSKVPIEAQKQPAGRYRRWVWLIALVILAISYAIWTSDPVSRTAKPEQPILQVSAGRGPSGLALTNREQVTLNTCTVKVLDEGDAEWEAPVPGLIQPSQTVHVDWSSFRRNRQPMPAYIGVNRKYFIVNCGYDGTDRVRRSAGIGF